MLQFTIARVCLDREPQWRTDNLHAAPRLGCLGARVAFLWRLLSTRLMIKEIYWMAAFP